MPGDLCIAGCDPAAWPVPVEIDDPLPNPARSARVGTGGRRWRPPVVQRASLRSDRWHGGWHRRATGRSSLRHPCNRKARVRSAPVGNGMAHHSGRRPARWGHCRVEVCTRGVTRSAAWPVPVETDDPLPQPGEVRTGWNRRTPLGPPVVQRASLRSDRWHGGWHVAERQADRHCGTRVTARPESARPPVGMARPITADGGLRAGATAGWQVCVAGCDPTGGVAGCRWNRRSAAPPGEVRTGWNRRTPLGPNGGPSAHPSVPIGGTVVGTAMAQADRHCARVTARPESARPPVEMARPITADGGLRAGASAGWRSASRDVTRPAAATAG